MEQDELDGILSRRYAPKAPKDLAERIIHAAISGIQELPTSRNIWAEIGAMFALPHPRVVVAMSILIGVVVGFQTGDGLAPLGQDWSSFLDIDEGGWL
jgi:hypothetical protein